MNINAFAFAACFFAAAVYSAVIPQHNAVSQATQPSGLPKLFHAAREGKQYYAPSYQQAPIYAYSPEKAAYNPYLAPAPVPTQFYYPSAYPSFPAPSYYPLREGSESEESSAEGSYWSYLPSSFNFGNYFNYPSWFGGSETESSSSVAQSPTTSAEAEQNNALLLRTGAPNAIKAYAPTPAVKYQPAQPQFIVAGQPQLYGHYSAFQGQDPSKLTAANNGAISSYLFLRNQPQLPIFQNNQQKFVAPPSVQNPNVKDAHQQFVQFSKQYEDQYNTRNVDKQAVSSENKNVIVPPAAENKPTEDEKKESTTGSTGQ